MKRILLAAMLALSGTAEASDLSNWSVDRDCVASSGIDWSEGNEGTALLAYNPVTNSINFGASNDEWRFKVNYSEKVLVVFGVDKKVQATAHVFKDTSLIVIEIPYSKYNEALVTGSKTMRVYSQNVLVLNLELVQVKEAFRSVYTCYTGGSV
jgi:hypothetical protein